MVTENEIKIGWKLFALLTYLKESYVSTLIIN